MQARLAALKVSTDIETPQLKVIEESKNVVDSRQVEEEVKQNATSAMMLTAGKPSFASVIKLQSSSGFWSSASRHVLAQCLENDQSEDADVMQALEQLGIPNDAMEQVYLTLLALFILEESFPENAQEWQMIARKAKTYLEQAGVAKPNNLVMKFTLSAKID